MARSSRPAGMLAATLVAALIMSGAHAQTVGIATNPQGTLAYATGSAIAKVASERYGLQARVQPHGGPNVNIPLINSGEADLAIVNMMVATFALTGTGDFEGRPQPETRLATALFPLRLGLLVRKDADIRTIADVKGRRISSDYRSQRNSWIMVEGLLAAAGLTPADVVGVPAPHVARGADDLTAGHVEVTFFSIGAGKMAEVDAAVGGIRFLPVDDSPEALATIRRHAPGSYVEVLAPAPRFVGIIGPTKVLVNPLVLLAGARASEEVIYKIVKAMHEEKAKLAAAMPAFNEFDPARMAVDSELSYHPGAIKFYQEAGQWPPKS